MILGQNQSSCQFTVCATPNTTDPYCGSVAPPNYISDGYYVRVEFISDHNTTGSGFEIGYTCNDLPPIECGGQLSGPSGLIHSPNWPNDYPLNANCSWGINCSHGETVTLEFNSFDIEHHSSCL